MQSNRPKTANDKKKAKRRAAQAESNRALEQEREAFIKSKAASAKNKYEQRRLLASKVMADILKIPYAAESTLAELCFNHPELRDAVPYKDSASFGLLLLTKALLGSKEEVVCLLLAEHELRTQGCEGFFTQFSHVKSSYQVGEEHYSNYSFLVISDQSLADKPKVKKGLCHLSDVDADSILITRSGVMFPTHQIEHEYKEIAAGNILDTTPSVRCITSFDKNLLVKAKKIAAILEKKLHRSVPQSLEVNSTVGSFFSQLLNLKNPADAKNETTPARSPSLPPREMDGQEESGLEKDYKLWLKYCKSHHRELVDELTTLWDDYSETIDLEKKADAEKRLEQFRLKFENIRKQDELTKIEKDAKDIDKQREVNKAEASLKKRQEFFVYAIAYCKQKKLAEPEAVFVRYHELFIQGKLTEANFELLKTEFDKILEKDSQPNKRKHQTPKPSTNEAKTSEIVATLKNNQLERLRNKRNKRKKPTAGQANPSSFFATNPAAAPGHDSISLSKSALSKTHSG